MKSIASVIITFLLLSQCPVFSAEEGVMKAFAAATKNAERQAIDALKIARETHEANIAAIKNVFKATVENSFTTLQAIRLKAASTAVADYEAELEAAIMSGNLDKALAAKSKKKAFAKYIEEQSVRIDQQWQTSNGESLPEIVSSPGVLPPSDPTAKVFSSIVGKAEQSNRNLVTAAQSRSNREAKVLRDAWKSIVNVSLKTVQEQQRQAVTDAIEAYDKRIVDITKAGDIDGGVRLKVEKEEFLRFVAVEKSRVEEEWAMLGSAIGDGEWVGSFLLYNRSGTVKVFVNNKQLFSSNIAGAKFSPEIVLRRDDVVVFDVQSIDGVIRAAFISDHKRTSIPLRAQDLKEVSESLVADIKPDTLAAINDTAVHILKVPLAELGIWDKAAGQDRLIPRGSEFVCGKDSKKFSLAFSVTDKMFQPLRESPAIESRTRKETIVFKCDDENRMAQFWKWDANFTIAADGTRGGRENSTLVSRFTLEGDFAIDLDASFSDATYTNTGGMLIAVCGEDLGFDGGWNFGSSDGFQARVRVQRLGDEIQLIRDGWALVISAKEQFRGKPTRWQLFWRSRDSHFREIKVQAVQIIPDRADEQPPDRNPPW